MLFVVCRVVPVSCFGLLSGACCSFVAVCCVLVVVCCLLNVICVLCVACVLFVCRLVCVV